MDLARITAKGQMTIPKRVRNALGIGRGDLLRVDVQGDRAILSKVALGGDAYLRSVESTLGEWASEEDENAYRDL